MSAVNIHGKDTSGRPARTGDSKATRGKPAVNLNGTVQSSEHSPNAEQHMTPERYSNGPATGPTNPRRGGVSGGPSKSAPKRK